MQSSELECPRCGYRITSQTLVCPSCGLKLKDNHPGIPIYYAAGAEPLCETCTYHADDTCNLPKRPFATDCTLYVHPGDPGLTDEPIEAVSSKVLFLTLNVWIRQNPLLAVLIVIVILSALLAL